MTPTKPPSRSMTIEAARADAERSLGRKDESGATASEFFARHMLTIARRSNLPRSLEIVEEILAMDPGASEREVFSSISGDWYYQHQARDLKAPLIQESSNPPPPTYWLIDQRGVLVDINGFVNLEKKVRRLFAEAEGQ